MPYNYAIRITHSYEQCQQIISRWSLECDKMAVYEHIGTATEKIHIHLVISGSRVQSKQLRNIAKRVSQLPLNGNENCSMKEWDLNESAIVYMTKGNLEPSYYKGYTILELSALREKWVEPTPRQQRQSDVARVYEANFTYEATNAEWRDRNDANPDAAISFVLFLRRKCLREAMVLNHQMMTPKTITDARTFYLTYCYRNGIRIAANDPAYRYVFWQTTEQQV